jgi:hypothetical protein
MVEYTCTRCGKSFPKLWQRTRHNNRKFQCRIRPQQSSTQSPTPVLHVRGRDRRKEVPRKARSRSPTPIPSEVSPREVEQQDAQTVNRGKLAEQIDDHIFLKQLGLIEETEEESSLLKRVFKDDKQAPEGDIHFEEVSVGDPSRPHPNLSALSKWEAVVPKKSNPAYAFNEMIGGGENYADAPYMPQLISSARKEITRVLQTELNRKEQIRSSLVVFCLYVRTEREPDGSIKPIYMNAYHRGGMRTILSKNDIEASLTLSGSEIDKKIEEFLYRGSSWQLIRIDRVFIEAYTYRRALGGSYIPTPKKLANTKCTINPDNQGLVDPETNALSEKCLQGALGAYFAHQDEHTEHLERIFRAKKLKPYLDIVKLDGIPMPTPVCPRIFNKIEEMNPDISINVWE